MGIVACSRGGRESRTYVSSLISTHVIAREILRGKNKSYVMALTLIAFREDFLSSLLRGTCAPGGLWGNVRAIDFSSVVMVGKQTRIPGGHAASFFLSFV